jgi:hypothetical protein
VSFKRKRYGGSPGSTLSKSGHRLHTPSGKNTIFNPTKASTGGLLFFGKKAMALFHASSRDVRRGQYRYSLSGCKTPFELRVDAFNVIPHSLKNNHNDKQKQSTRLKKNKNNRLLLLDERMKYIALTNVPRENMAA